jgi:hypothetical protein
MIGISSHLLPAKNLNVLHTFGEYPSEFENMNDFQSWLGVFGDTHTVTSSTFRSFTRHYAAQMSPHDFEAANLNDTFAMFFIQLLQKMRHCHNGGVIFFSYMATPPALTSCRPGTVSSLSVHVSIRAGMSVGASTGSVEMSGE